MDRESPKHPSVANIEYRYTLSRGPWIGHDAQPSGRLCWVMLNPSTADAHVDDPTIRRVVRFTKDNGYSDLVVVNLFAARTTRPVHLREMGVQAVGPRNRQAVATEMELASAVVFAWGAYPHYRRGVPADGIALVLGITPLCLGRTKDGHPRHPLYVPANQPFEEYPL